VTRPILTPSHVTVNSGHHILKTTTVKSHQWPTLSELIAFICTTQISCVIHRCVWLVNYLLRIVIVRFGWYS